MNRRRRRTVANGPWKRRDLMHKIGLALLTDSVYTKHTAVALMLLELVVAVLVVNVVPYTEIDWKAYMQQASTFLQGTKDYSMLVGDTGPLVYPAGHLYIYAALYEGTSSGTNIRLAQYIFVCVYLVHMALVFAIYVRCSKIPPCMLILMVVISYRIHSIFMLRLFNDCIAMTLFYLAVLLWSFRCWTLGIVAYSLALSVKMNILLFAPAVAIIYWFGRGYRSAILHALLALAIQVLLALPFLLENPAAYLQRAFNFGRVFDHRWTVNWRFLPEEVFQDTRFHQGLLCCHVVALAAFVYAKFLRSPLSALIQHIHDGFAYFRRIGHDRQVLQAFCGMKRISIKPQDMVLLLAGCNTVGVMFSRTLHYQFYEWYFHLLPFLAWKTHLPLSAQITLLGCIEISWNVYPSTNVTSALLHVCHAVLLACVLFDAKVNSIVSKCKKS